MKKVVVISVVMVMLFSLVSCASQQEKDALEIVNSTKETTADTYQDYEWNENEGVLTIYFSASPDGTDYSNIYNEDKSTWKKIIATWDELSETYSDTASFSDEPFDVELVFINGTDKEDVIYKTRNGKCTYNKME